MIEIKEVVDDKILVAWKDSAPETKINGIIVPTYRTKNVGENRGIVRMVGINVKKINIGDYIMFAVGTIYEPFETDRGKEIIIPEDDVIMIMEEPLSKTLNIFCDLNVSNIDDDKNINTDSGHNYTIAKNVRDISDTEG